MGGRGFRLEKVSLSTRSLQHQPYLNYKRDLETKSARVGTIWTMSLLTFFVGNGIQQYPQGPYILFLATVWLALEHFRRSIIWTLSVRIFLSCQPTHRLCRQIHQKGRS